MLKDLLFWKLGITIQKNLIIQQLPVKERENKIENNRMRNGYIIDTVTSVDVQEIIKIGGKVIEIYEGVIDREKFRVSPFRKDIDKISASKQKWKGENNDVMQLLLKLLMNSWFGEQIRKDIVKKFASNSEYWMMSENGQRGKAYWRLSHGYYIVKVTDGAGLEDEVKILNTMPLHLGAFVLSNSKWIMINFIHAKSGFFTNDVFSYRYGLSIHWEEGLRWIGQSWI